MLCLAKSRIRAETDEIRESVSAFLPRGRTHAHSFRSSGFSRRVFSFAYSTFPSSVVQGPHARVFCRRLLISSCCIDGCPGCCQLFSSPDVLRVELLETEKRSSWTAKGKEASSLHCGWEGRMMRLRTRFIKRLGLSYVPKTLISYLCHTQTKIYVAKIHHPQMLFLN